MMAIAYLVNVHVEQRYAGAFKRQLNEGWTSLRTLIVPAR
jgi:hypothetical protein